MGQLRKIVLVAAIGALASGCNIIDRLASVGEKPKMTVIQNPTQAPNYRPVSMPMPAAEPAVSHANSLWRPGARQFFKDQRASSVGDILTVTIAIDDSADISNKTTQSRTGTETADATNFLGFENTLDQVLPNGVDPSSLVDLNSDHETTGDGTIQRGETINLKIAAVVTQRLPNGNLVVHGRQEIQVNFEVRELQIAGVVRPEDIGSDNTISYEKIAEARIAYGGRGQITDLQQPRYGQQIFDILWPF